MERLRNTTMEMKNLSVLETLKEHDRDFKISMIKSNFDTQSRNSLYQSMPTTNRQVSISKMNKMDQLNP